MKQEENLKQLLLKELSSRLPYGVVVNYKGLARPLFGIEPTQYFQITLDRALDGEHNGLVYVSLDVDGEVPKPYLRPLSSMTEKEFDDMFNQFYSAQEEFFRNCSNTDTIAKLIANDTVRYDWFYEHHFDVRHLIEKNLAIEVTEENNPYK